MKLRINNIKFKNFLSYGKIQQDIDFLSGVNLVVGYDPVKERSNRAGKSSFLSTVPFALFGKTDRAVRKEQLVNWKNKKNCEVILDFEMDDNKYKILRALKPDKLEIYENEKLIPFTDARSYQNFLEEEILKIDLQTFLSLFYTNLNYMSPILKMKKPDKRRFLETIFGLDFSVLNEACNLKINSIEKKIHSISIAEDVDAKTISQLESQNENLSSKIKHSSIDDIESRLEEIKRKEKKCKEASKKIEEKLSDLQISRDEFKEEIEEHRSKLQNLNTKYEVITSEKKSFNERISSLKRDVSKKDFLLKDKKEYDELGSLESIEEEIESIEKDMTNLKKESKSKSESLQELREGLAGLKSKLEDIQNRDEKLEGKEFCPLCGTELRDTNIIDHMKKETHKLKTHISEKTKQITFESDSLRSIESRLDDLSANTHSLNSKKTKILKLAAKVEELKNIELKESEIDKIKKELENKEKNISKIESLRKDMQDVVQKHQNVLEKANNQIDEYKQELNELQNISRERELLQVKLDGQKNSVDSFRKIISENTKKIRKLRQGLETGRKEKEKLEEMSDYISYIKTLCKDEYVKQYAISSIMPMLNKQTNHYLSESGMDFYIKFDKWLDGTIEGPGIVDGSYNSLSGGEARSIDLSLQFGFLDVSRIKAVVDPDMLILDELLDSSVDAVGLSSILNIVRVRQHEDSNKVFIITHRQEVNDLDVDNIYKVKRIEGFSYVDIVK